MWELINLRHERAIRGKRGTDVGKVGSGLFGRGLKAVAPLVPVKDRSSVA
jgi:hypothetical protein